MKEEKARIHEFLEKSAAWLPRIQRYSLPLFIVFVVLVYGIVLFRIHSLSDARPTQNQVSSQVKAARIPRIDPAVVQQLQTLQDNSVSVQALFNQARNNPFQ